MEVGFCINKATDVVSLRRQLIPASLVICDRQHIDFTGLDDRTT